MPASPELPSCILYAISPRWALYKISAAPRVEGQRVEGSPCWERLGGDTRPQFSIGSTRLEKHRVRSDFHHLLGSGLTFKRLNDKLHPHKASRSRKLKLMRAALANLGSLPPNSAGLEVSHLCGNPACFAPGHIVWEEHAVNTNRDLCFASEQVICAHSRACIRGPIISRVEIKGTPLRGGRRRKGLPPPSLFGDTRTPEPAAALASTLSDPSITPPLTPPGTQSQQLRSLDKPCPPHLSLDSRTSSSSSPPSTSTSCSARTSRASSELSVVPDSEAEDELVEPAASVRRRSVEILDLTASDEEGLSDYGVDTEDEDDDDDENEEEVVVEEEEVAPLSTRKAALLLAAEQRRKRLFDLVNAEMASLQRPTKRQRLERPAVRRLLNFGRDWVRKSRLWRRPLASWVKVFKVRRMFR